ncbi:MAG: carbon-nitrogen hydrolase family protein [Pseudomonadota bacterium]
MSEAHPKFKAAAVQYAPRFLDLSAGLDLAQSLIAEAANDGARLIAFPECWLPGYPFHVWLGPPAWGLQFQQRYFDNSLDLQSEHRERLCEMARENKIFVSMGFSERAGGSLYIAQILIDDCGEVVNSRRKLKPTHVERTVYGEGDGSDLKVFGTALGQLGQMCCWEHLQPLSRYALYAQNEQVHIAAWPSFSLYTGIAHALGPEVNNGASMMYAAEGQCYVIAPCATVSAEMIEMFSPNHEGLLCEGGGYTKIYAPDGQSIGTEIAPHEEGLVYADIDLSMIALAKAAGDPAGHYARADVTCLLLNDQPRRALVSSNDAPTVLDESSLEDGA